MLKKLNKLEDTKQRADTEVKSQKFDEAVKLYTECLQLDPQLKKYNATIYYERASAYMSLKNYKDALTDINKSIDLNQNSAKAYFQRVEIQIKLEDYKAALSDIQKVKELDARYPGLNRKESECHRLMKLAARKDYYKILGVEKSAKEQEIKKMYRQLALKCHPDKVQGSEEEKKQAENKFKEISEAYSVLMDANKRKRYDLGEDEDIFAGGEKVNLYVELIIE